jgi:hypothetical protein
MPESIYNIGTKEEKQMADLIHIEIDKWGYAETIDDDFLSWPTKGSFKNQNITELITSVGKKSDGTYVILFDVHSEYELVDSFYSRYEMQLGISNVYENADLYVGKVEYWKHKNKLT